MSVNVIVALRRQVRVALMGRWMPATRFARQLGPLTDCHNEWSLISDAFGEEQSSSPELLRIALDAVVRASRTEAGFLDHRAMNVAVRTWPGEHYRLLPALCDAAGARRVIEIGTWKGLSAAAFLASPTVDHVDTFDIVPWKEIQGSVLTDDDFGTRLTQHVSDLGDPNMFARYEQLFTSADLIFADGPKDGAFEASFLNRVLEVAPNQRQLILLDDIRLMTMVRLWRSLPAPKLDLTSFGHWSGTGLLLR